MHMTLRDGLWNRLHTAKFLDLGADLNFAERETVVDVAATLFGRTSDKETAGRAMDRSLVAAIKAVRGMRT